MNWSQPSQVVWKSGNFEIYRVDSAADAGHGGSGVLFELCRGETFVGNYPTLQDAMDAAMHEALWGRS